MKKIILAALIMLTLNAYGSKLYKAKILFTDGQKYEGYATLPSNDLFSGNVSYSESEDGKLSKLEDNNIRAILYTTNGGNQYYFEHTQYRQLFGKDREKTSKKKSWALMTFSHDFIASYYLAQSYFIDKDEKIISKSVDRTGTWADIFILFKRPGEAVPTMITSLTHGATIIGQEKMFRRIAMQYFNSENKFSERIDNKEFKHDEIQSLVTAYISYKEGK